ncbi:MAG: cytochrome c peroxidase [Cytophagales bacterium]|nr:cytochrome c peroxidase [Cytophagales bacterium]
MNIFGTNTITSLTLPKVKFLMIGIASLLLWACNPDSEVVNIDDDSDDIMNDDPVNQVDTRSITEVFGESLSLESPLNYADQSIPNYINEDNTTRGNQIENEIATLGRVLFYDKNLSSDNSTSCASCHKQTLAFGDDAVLSQGVNGVTGRHSMRLVNARFSEEERFFWDERANSLETQTTMPIQDHIEMGFSGNEGDDDINGLIAKMEGIDYLVNLFEYAYGTNEISEERMQLALAQFVRSIQSFDSKYDVGLAQAGDEDDDFDNFSVLENMGKDLFMGRAGCERCHNAPEFSINDNSRNNGVITVAGDPDAVDTEVTRSPTLRDIFNPGGTLNGPMMHDGGFATFEEVLNHYSTVGPTPENNNLDDRLEGRRGGNRNLDNQDITAIIAFVQTLTGTEVYTDERWSDPFLP